MSPIEDFKTTLTGVLNEKSGKKQLAIFDGLMDKLLELLTGLFDQCLGQLSPSEVAERVSAPSELTKIRFRTRVRKAVYKNSEEYAAQGGKAVADSVLEVTAAMGLEKCTALVKQVSEGDEWFPFNDFVM